MTTPPLTVLYDEDCGVCAGLASWLERSGLAVAPIGSALGDRGLRDLSPEQRYASVHVVDTVGRRRSGPDALPAILRAVPHLGWTAPLLEAAPGPTAWGYELVTRHRHALSRLLRLESCRRPGAAAVAPDDAVGPVAVTSSRSRDRARPIRPPTG